MNLRFVVGKRVGVASSGRTDEEGLRRLAANAGRDRPASSRSSRTGAACPGRRTAEDVEAGYSTATAGASPESRAEGVREVIAAADAAGVTAYGSFSTGHGDDRRRQLEGRPPASGRGPCAQLLTVSMGPDGGTGYAEAAAVDSTTIDAAAIGREAADKARATANAVAVDAGDYPVVLEEYAVVDILDMLGYLGFSALAVQEERSFVEPGKRIGSDLVTITDDGRDPAGLPMCVRLRGRRQAARPARRGRRVPRGRLRRPDRGARRRGARPATACPRRTRTARSR